MSDYLENDSIESIIAVYADQGYNTKRIREYLKSRNIMGLHPSHKFQNKTQQNKPEQIQDKICGGDILCMIQVWIPQNYSTI